MKSVVLQTDRGGRAAGQAPKGSASVALLLVVAMHVVSAGTLAAAASVGARLEVTAERLVYGRAGQQTLSGWAEGRSLAAAGAPGRGETAAVAPVGERAAFAFGDRVGPLHLDLPPPLS
ncbi:MAG: hypothetical protein AAF356_10660 [Planctomycetota bacterium]